MHQQPTTQAGRLLSARVDWLLVLKCEIFDLLCKREGLTDRGAFREAFAEKAGRKRKDQSLARSVNRWFKRGDPVRMERQNAVIVCQVLKVQELAGLFELSTSLPDHSAYYALADSLFRDFSEVSATLPRTPKPSFDLVFFDALLNYANWKSALVRKRDAVNRTRGTGDQTVEEIRAGERAADRAHTFARNLYGVLSVLLEDARTDSPRKAQWATILNLFEQLRGVLHAPLRRGRMRREARELVGRLKREWNEEARTKSREDFREAARIERVRDAPTV